MSFKVNENVTWVGKIDWELQTFHGEEYSVHKGTSYNSYLVRDEKTVLIDTVWEPFAEEFVENLKKEIDLNEIDYIIANHAEIDHSGALPLLMKEIPETPIYCTSNGVKSLKGHFHEDWNFVTVKTGDTLNIGSKELIFIEARMLHWPDSMFCYLTGDNILFSNDAFGQHYASELMYNDLVDQAELYQQAIKYYANILTPFSKLVESKINEVVAEPTRTALERNTSVMISFLSLFPELCNTMLISGLTSLIPLVMASAILLVPFHMVSYTMVI